MASVLQGPSAKAGTIACGRSIKSQPVLRAEGLEGYGDWLGTGRGPSQRMIVRPFRRARAFVRQLGLKSHSEWRAYCAGRLPGLGRRPVDIPACPYSVYSDKGWKGYRDWLAAGRVRQQKSRPTLRSK